MLVSCLRDVQNVIVDPCLLIHFLSANPLVMFISITVMFVNVHIVGALFRAAASTDDVSLASCSPRNCRICAVKILQYVK